MIYLGQKYLKHIISYFQLTKLVKLLIRINFHQSYHLFDFKLGESWMPRRTAYNEYKLYDNSMRLKFTKNRIAILKIFG